MVAERVEAEDTSVVRSIMLTVGERFSRACRWLWGTLNALGGLDDAREAREIREAQAALQALCRQFDLACADGIITPAERGCLKVAARRAAAEMADVEAYDRAENALHAEALDDAQRARNAIAPLSRATDLAPVQSYHGHDDPVAVLSELLG